MAIAVEINENNPFSSIYLDNWHGTLFSRARFLLGLPPLHHQSYGSNIPSNIPIKCLVYLPLCLASDSMRKKQSSETSWSKHVRWYPLYFGVVSDEIRCKPNHKPNPSRITINRCGKNHPQSCKRFKYQIWININPKRLFYYGGTIEVSYEITIWGNPPNVDKLWFINPGVTLWGLSHSVAPPSAL